VTRAGAKFRPVDPVKFRDRQYSLDGRKDWDRCTAIGGGMGFAWANVFFFSQIPFAAGLLARINRRVKAGIRQI